MIELRPCECQKQRLNGLKSIPYFMDDFSGSLIRVRCDSCPASTAWYDTNDLAAAAWNARTDDDYRRLHAQLCDTEAKRAALEAENN